MIALLLLAALAQSPGGRHDNAGALPVCSNRVINQVVRRAGCTVGDARCWLRSRGFCTDHVERRAGPRRSAKAGQMTRIRPEEVAKGDVAEFASRAHYAYVEGVVQGKDGRPVAVNLSEVNYGTCWVDAESMVTERYGVVGRRSGVALGEVDGGFLRPRPAAR